MKSLTIKVQLPPIVQFYLSNEAYHQAAHLRVNLLRDHLTNDTLSEDELLNILGTVKDCYLRKRWMKLIEYQDILQHYLDLQGQWQTAIRINEWACEAAQALGDDINVARWTHDRADICNQQGQYKQAEALYVTAESAYIELGMSESALMSRHQRTLVLRAQGNIVQAKKLCAATIKEAQKLNMGNWLAHPYYIQALIERDFGDFAAAENTIAKCLEIFNQISDTIMIAHCHHFLGELLLLKKADSKIVKPHLEYSLQLSEQAGILRRVAATQRLLGDMERFEESYEKADYYYNQAFEISTQVGDQPQLARLLISKAMLAKQMNRERDSINSFQSAIQTYQKTGDARGIAGVSILLAQELFRQGQLLRAIALAFSGLKAGWTNRLLNPRILLGVLRRWQML